ncbi:MAG: translesion DNA synthesis-associated protein ImuA [Roseibium album]|uniref:translesion DNA synthesis-associated protein ImuA n=1 Tax=Roseibium album TaxID=311410 RepID=UPI0032EDC10E
MSRSEHLDGLLRHPGLWRAGQLGAAPDAVATGHDGLDAHLPGGGWPAAGLTELLLDTAGVGELRLLLPLLRTLSREQARWIAWIDPPFVPYAPALEAAGVDISRILLIHPKDHDEALWALERASRSGNCSLVLAWPDDRRLKVTDTRRVQLAARQGRTLACLFRPAAAAGVNSMAELRLRLTPRPDRGVAVDILKRRGGWPVTGLELRISDALQPTDIREQLSLWRHGGPTQTRRQRQDPAPDGVTPALEPTLPYKSPHKSQGPAPERSKVLH